MKIRHWPRALPLVFTLLAPLLQAPAVYAGLTAQQQLFVKTREQMQRGQWTLAKQNMAALKQYPLYPYLEVAALIDRLDSLPTADVDAFLQRYPDTVMSDLLSAQWLAALARASAWNDYLTYYRAEGASRSQQCWYVEALHQTGKTAQALSETTQLWLTADSPDACETPFKRWLASSQRDEALIWQRLLLALERKQETLARKLAVEIDEIYKVQAGYALVLHRDPAALPNLLPQIVREPAAGSVIAPALKTLAKRAPEMAAALWRQTTDAKQLSPEQSALVRTEIGRQLIVARDAEALPWLVQNDPKGEDAFLLEWRLRFGLRAGDWANIAQWTELLPADLAQSQRWQYWRARALAEQGGDADKQKASAIFATLAQERSYYGFLAADKMNTPYQFKEPPQAAPLSSVERRADIVRAHEFYVMKDRVRAEREWQRALRALSNSEQHAAARLAQRWGWYNQGIRTALRSGAHDDLELRFPLVYREPIKGAAKNTALPMDWIYAIARQESAFLPDARSSAGALGLLQLMPGTAKQVARQLRVKITPQQLTQPEPSIRLGSTYLRDMLRRFDGNRVVATAAYNAGPRRIGNLLKEYPVQVGADVWVETLPYKETREYVQNVLAFSVIYGHRLGRNNTLLAADETLIGRPELQVTRSDSSTEVTN